MDSPAVTAPTATLAQQSIGVPSLNFRNGLGIALALLFVALCAPIFWVETSCVAPQASGRNAVHAGLDKEAGYRRPAGDTFLVYPEWYVIDAYGDLAAVARANSESAFDYGRSIAGFWISLCATTEAASRSGAIPVDRKIGNYLAGYVFSTEMGIKGIWERTLGAAAVWLRGPVRTSEDEVGLRILNEYATFLKKSPGGQFPFAQERDRFWRETPTAGDGFARRWERRAAIVMGYTARGFYSHPAAQLDPAAPADRKIKGVVDRLDKADLAAEPRIVKLRDLPDGAVLVETPRGVEFPEIFRRLAERGRDFVEIAGARRILTTVLVPPDKTIDFGGAREIFSTPVQAKPGWRRIGFDTDLETAAGQIALVEGQGAIFERAYD